MNADDWPFILSTIAITAGIAVPTAIALIRAAAGTRDRLTRVEATLDMVVGLLMSDGALRRAHAGDVVLQSDPVPTRQWQSMIPLDLEHELIDVELRRLAGELPDAGEPELVVAIVGRLGIERIEARALQISRESRHQLVASDYLVMAVSKVKRVRAGD